MSNRAKPILMLAYSFALLLCVSIFDGAIALDEDQDQQQFREWIPRLKELTGQALKFNEKKQFDKTSALYESAAEEWSKMSCKTADGERAKQLRRAGLLNFSALAHKKSKEFSQAALIYLKCNKIVGQFPGSGELRYKLDAADAYRQDKDFGKAEDLCKSVINASQAERDLSEVSLLQADIVLAQTYEDSGKSQLAEKVLKDFIAQSLKAGDVRGTRTARISLKNMMLTQKRIDDLAKVEADLNDKHCPVCHSDAAVLPVAYGLQLEPLLMSKVHVSEVMFRANSPQWWCEKDRIGF